MKLLSYIPSWLKNKYLLTGAFFLVWMFFFDPTDINSDLAYNVKLKELQKNESHLTSLIAQTQSELAQLKTNAESIEKYARENYFMKKDNEDIFIVPAPAEATK